MTVLVALPVLGHGVDIGHVAGMDHRPDGTAHVVEGDAAAQDAVELGRTPEGLAHMVDLVDPGLGRAQRHAQPPGVGPRLAPRFGQGRDVVHIGDDPGDLAVGVAPGTGFPAQGVGLALAVVQLVLAAQHRLAGQGPLDGRHEPRAGPGRQLMQAAADHLVLGGLEDLQEARADHPQAQVAVVERHREGGLLDQSPSLALAPDGGVTGAGHVGDVLRDALEGEHTVGAWLGAEGGAIGEPLVAGPAQAVLDRRALAGAHGPVEGLPQPFALGRIQAFEELVGLGDILGLQARGGQDVARPLDVLAVRLVAPHADAGRRGQQFAGLAGGRQLGAAGHVGGDVAQSADHLAIGPQARLVLQPHPAAGLADHLQAAQGLAGGADQAGGLDEIVSRVRMHEAQGGLADQVLTGPAGHPGPGRIDRGEPALRNHGEQIVRVVEEPPRAFSVAQPCGHLGR